MSILVWTHIYNEAPRLQRWLDNVTSWADDFMILDDGSTDGSYDILRTKIPENRIIRDATNDWAKEAEKHARSYEKIREIKPTFIVPSAADELIPPSAVPLLKEDLKNLKPELTLRVRHAEPWNSQDFYRIDRWWSKTHHPRAWRFQESDKFATPADGVHRPSFPDRVLGKKYQLVNNWRVLHTGYQSLQDILNHFERYRQLVDAGRFGSVMFYDNFVRILDWDGADWERLPDDYVRAMGFEPNHQALRPDQPYYDGGWIVPDTHRYRNYIDKWYRKNQ